VREKHAQIEGTATLTVPVPQHENVLQDGSSSQIITVENSHSHILENIRMKYWWFLRRENNDLK